MQTLWSAERIALELDLLNRATGKPSAKAARSLMEALGVKKIYLGPGRGRGYRWRPTDVFAAIEAREVGKVQKAKQPRRRETVFDRGLSVAEQMAALLQIGGRPAGRNVQ